MTVPSGCSSQGLRHANTSDEPAMNPKSLDAVRAFYENFIASGATKLELDVDRTGPKRTCCAELESGLFRTLEEVHGLRPYALKAAARGGAPMNVSDICRRGKGPTGWDLLVWDRPDMDASTSGRGVRSDVLYG